MAMTPQDKKRVKELNAQVKVLQEKLVDAKKREGKDDYIEVKIQNNQARGERVRKRGEDDKAFGHFFLHLTITAKQATVYVPISIATGKKTAGFMYQIEGTAEASVMTGEVRVRGEGVSQVTVGTLRFAKIPTGKTASFEIRSTIRGRVGKRYKLVFTRLNYKLALADARYQQYLKEIYTSTASLL